MKYIDRKDVPPQVAGNKVIEVAADWDKMEVAQVVEPAEVRGEVGSIAGVEVWSSNVGGVCVNGDVIPASPELDVPPVGYNPASVNVPSLEAAVRSFENHLHDMASEQVREVEKEAEDKKE